MSSQHPPAIAPVNVATISEFSRESLRLSVKGLKKREIEGMSHHTWL